MFQSVCCLFLPVLCRFHYMSCFLSCLVYTDRSFPPMEHLYQNWTWLPSQVAVCSMPPAPSYPSPTRTHFKSFTQSLTFSPSLPTKAFFLSHSHSQILTHTLTHTHSHIHTHTHTHSHTPPSHTHSHRHTRTLLSCFLFQTTQSLPYFHSSTFSHSASCSHSTLHSFTPSLTFPPKPTMSNF